MLTTQYFKKAQKLKTKANANETYNVLFRLGIKKTIGLWAEHNAKKLLVDQSFRANLYCFNKVKRKLDQTEIMSTKSINLITVIKNLIW